MDVGKCIIIEFQNTKLWFLFLFSFNAVINAQNLIISRWYLREEEIRRARQMAPAHDGLGVVGLAQATVFASWNSRWAEIGGQNPPELDGFLLTVFTFGFS